MNDPTMLVLVLLLSALAGFNLGYEIGFSDAKEIWKEGYR